MVWNRSSGLNRRFGNPIEKSFVITTRFAQTPLKWLRILAGPVSVIPITEKSCLTALAKTIKSLFCGNKPLHGLSREPREASWMTRRMTIDLDVDRRGMRNGPIMSVYANRQPETFIHLNLPVPFHTSERGIVRLQFSQVLSEADEGYFPGRAHQWMRLSPYADRKAFAPSPLQDGARSLLIDAEIDNGALRDEGPPLLQPPEPVVRRKRPVRSRIHIGAICTDESPVGKIRSCRDAEPKPEIQQIVICLRITLEELGERSSITGAFVAHIEAGRKRATLETVSKLARALNLAPHELLRPELEGVREPGEWYSAALSRLLRHKTPTQKKKLLGMLRSASSLISK